MRRLLIGTGCVAAAIVVALGVVGCGGTPVPSPSPSPLGLTHSGSQISVAVGEEFVIVLEENPSTGYSWSMVFDPGLELLRDVPEVPSPVASDDARQIADDGVKQVKGDDAKQVKGGGAEQIMGAPVKHRWVVRATKAGTFKVKGQYRRSWEHSVAPSEVFTLTVKAT